MEQLLFPVDGGCACAAVRFRVETAPLFVHCCHCRWCQRETGSAYAINAMIESTRVHVIAGEPVTIHTPSESGKGQDIVRCPECQVAVWSHFAGAGPAISFVRVGTLDNPDACPPDVHIFTESSQGWIDPGDGVPVFPRFYKRAELWPQSSLDRIRALT